MSPKEIAVQRLRSQQLAGGHDHSPASLVAHFGAMQAQDYAMSRWAIGVRTGNTDREIETAIDAGQIIRTHVLRPTWHLVDPADVRWMLALTSPGVKRAYMGTARTLGMDDKFLRDSNKKIGKLLAKGDFLTREEIMASLKLKPKNELENDFRPSLIMMHAEQDAIVCNGPSRGRQQTYALMDARVPPAPAIDRDEALAKLACIYFTSHGPATVADFGWWSGLGVGDSRWAAEAAASALSSFQSRGRTYLFAEGGDGAAGKSVHFLPAFDEYLISYKDREASIQTKHQPHAFTKNGIFKPVIVVDGQVVGTWKREIQGNKVAVETTLFENISARKTKNYAKELINFAAFVDKELFVKS